MSRYWSAFPSYSQPSAEELRRRAQASISAAKKKGLAMEPAVPLSRQGPVCQSWWGQAWCENLERYADFGSRLERGRRYIRSGAVVDLKIRKGRIEARVQGSRRIPYKVDIRISPLSEEKCQTILEKCGRRIQTMEDLVYGKFPEELKELFTQKDGLFPSPAEISFMCSCPDWALMCKHVAAVMYGIGLRLDENPFYFFELRGIDVDRFIDVALDSKVESMLEHASVATSRMMDAAFIPEIFGVLGPEHVFPAAAVSADQAKPEDEAEPANKADPAGEPVHEEERTGAGKPEDEAETVNGAERAGDADRPEETNPVQTQAKRLPELFYQSNEGGEISHEELVARILKQNLKADHIYVKPGENRAYWTAGDQKGSVMLWE